MRCKKMFVSLGNEYSEDIIRFILILKPKKKNNKYVQLFNYRVVT